MSASSQPVVTTHHGEAQLTMEISKKENEKEMMEILVVSMGQMQLKSIMAIVLGSERGWLTGLEQSWKTPNLNTLGTH